MPLERGLPDLLQRTRDVRGDLVFYGFANGLTIKTEVFNKSDRMRILPLGTPQGSLMNHLLGFEETARGKRVLEPFAGSGAIGFMTLKAGASHVTFLDVNPRAADFQRDNAALNGFTTQQFTSITGDIADFAPARRSELIIANPPFVPTPDGIGGTLTSNGGPDGSRFVAILLERLEELLEPAGRAIIYVFQFVRNGQPLIFDLLSTTVNRRSIDLTPAQLRPIPVETYFEAYRRLFPDDIPAIEGWRSALIRDHGDGLTLGHYVVDIGPRRDGPTECLIRDDFVEKFGAAFLVPSDNEAELTFGRVFENFVPPPAAE